VCVCVCVCVYVCACVTSYPGHVGGGECGLVYTVCACVSCACELTISLERNEYAGQECRLVPYHFSSIVLAVVYIKVYK